MPSVLGGVPLGYLSGAALLSYAASCEGFGLKIENSAFDCDVGIKIKGLGEVGTGGVDAVDPPVPSPPPPPVCAEDVAVDPNNFVGENPIAYMSGRTGLGNTAEWESSIPDGVCVDHPGAENQLLPSFSKSSYGVKSSIESHYENWWGDVPYDLLIHDDRQKIYFQSPFDEPFSSEAAQVLESAGYSCEDLKEPLGLYELLTHPIWDVLADVPLNATVPAEELVQRYPEFGAYTRSPVGLPLLQPDGAPLMREVTYKDAFQRVQASSKAEFCALGFKDINFSMLVPQVGGTFRYTDADLDVPNGNVENLRGTTYSNDLAIHHIYCESCEAEGVGTCAEAYEAFGDDDRYLSLALRYWHQMVSFGENMYSPCFFPPPPRTILPDDREFCGEDDPNYDQHYVAGPNGLYPADKLYTDVIVSQFNLPDNDESESFFCSMPHDFYLSNPSVPSEYRIYHHFCDFCGGKELLVCDGYNAYVNVTQYVGCIDLNTFGPAPSVAFSPKTAPTCGAIQDDINATLEPLYPLPNCDRMPYACQNLTDVCSDPNLEERRIPMAARKSTLRNVREPFGKSV